MFLSLVWYTFLLLPFFTFTCSGVRGSLVVVVCPFFPTFSARILPFYHPSDFHYTCLIMRTSSGPSRPFGLHIRGSSAVGSDLWLIGGGSDHPATVVDRVPLAGPPSPYSKGKGKISEIRYPGSSAYLRAAVQNAEAMGPSWVEPSFGHNFASRYKPPFGVRVWCPDFLTSYIVQVPKMICFFEAGRPSRMASAFLCIPLSKATYNILMSVRPNFLPTSGAFWSGCWSSLGIKVSGYLAFLCS